jgi:hypothetical protein
MPHEKLHRLLLDLQTELAAPAQLNPEELAQLRSVEERIRALLHSGEGEGVRQSVQETIAGVETAHPQAAGVLRQVVDTLSAMGI